MLTSERSIWSPSSPRHDLEDAELGEFAQEAHRHAESAGRVGDEERSLIGCRERKRLGRADRRALQFDRDAPAVELGELVADHGERQEVVALQAQDHLDAGDVGGRELAVPAGRAFRCDQALVFEEPDLGDREVGVVGLKPLDDLADGEIVAAAHQASAPAW